MAVIKLNASGQVILRGGLPSCTCCGYPTLYVEYTRYTSVDDGYGNMSRVGTTSYGTMTRSGPGSEYEEYFPDGGGGFYVISTLGWNSSAGQWQFNSLNFGAALGPSDITNPVGAYVDKDHPELDPMVYYEESDVDMLEAYVSLTPIP